MHRHSLASALSFASTAFTLLALAACGGGGGGGDSSTTTAAAPNPPASSPTPAAPCPTGHRSITLDSSSVPNAQLSLTSRNASFAFSTPASDPQPSIRLCLGQAATPLTMAGYYTLSETYELTVTPLNAQTSGIDALLQRKLRIYFSMAGLPAGTSPSDVEQKTTVFSPDASGVWQPAPSSATRSFPPSNVNTIANHIEFAPSSGGRFVVAYKP